MTADDTKNAASPRGKEIERKFLVCGQSWRSLGTPDAGAISMALCIRTVLPE